MNPGYAYWADLVRRLNLKTCASLDVPETECPPIESGKRVRIFRDPAGMKILSRIADGLLEGGYHVSKVRPAYGIEAGCACRLSSDFEVSIILGVSRRQQEFVTCVLITRHFPPLINRLFGRREMRAAERVDEWRQLCRMIEHQVVERLGVTSVLWLTEEEAGD